MRPRCLNCDYILERCLCEVLRPISNKTELIILQHPSEKKHALNTVHLMKKSFERIRVLHGENFNEEAELVELIKKNGTALLFPGKNATHLTKETAPPFTQLILLDGTWKKAKKIFYSSTILHQLPKFSIAADIKSQYRIRQSSMENSFSTLEATVAALGLIEPGLNCESVMNAFVRMIDFQIEKMGSETYKKNYRR